MEEKYCTFCGNVINKDDLFCNNCGGSLDGNKTSSTPPQQQPIQPQQQSVQPQHSPVASSQQYHTPQSVTTRPPIKKRNQTSETAFMLSLLGLFLIPIIGSVLGIIFGSIGLQSPYSRNKAIGAIILGVIGVAVGIVAFGFIFEWF